MREGAVGEEAPDRVVVSGDNPEGEILNVSTPL